MPVQPMQPCMHQCSQGTCGSTQALQPGRSAATGSPRAGRALGQGSREQPVPAGALRRMAPGRGAACGARGAAGACRAAQTALCKAAAGHRQLVLQLGGSADSPRLREERHRRSAEARELSAGLRSSLLEGLRQATAPEERRELERLWVLFLSVLELFLQDLCRAHQLCRVFSLGAGGVALLHTGLGRWRGGGPELPPAPLCLEEEMEQVRAMLVEMESTANIPLWSVEATQVAGLGEGAAPTSWGPWAGPCCSVL